MIHSRNIITIVFLAVFVLMSVGCHHDSATMQQLSRIDSLLTIARQYEEALQRLDAQETYGFNKAEQAYYSLLVTQAHYKNYIDDTTDAVIKVAVDYYKNSNDKEKYTRSLIYQGCVNELNGNPEKAVECFKKAEETAADDDISNKAYIKLRLADLYQGQFVGAESIGLNKYHEALDLFSQINDRHYQILCMTEIGGLYCEKKEKADSALYYINKSIEMCKADGERYHLFANYYAKALYYLDIKHNYVLAKQSSALALALGDQIDHPRVHYAMARACLNIGELDSAKYYLNAAMRPINIVDSIAYYNVLSEIEGYEHHEDRSRLLFEISNSLADSVLAASLNHRLLAVEKKYDVQLAVLNRVQSEARLNQALLLAALLALALFALAFLVWRYKNQLKMRQNEVEMLKADLDGSLHSLQQMQARLDSQGQDDEGKARQSDELRAIISQQINAVHQLMEWSYQYDGDKFAAKFREMMTVPGVSDDSNYWSHLQSLVNELHDNVLVKAQEEAGGALTETELNLLALYCCGFSRTVIMVTMGYKNIGTVYNKKLQISKKLHVNNLDDYVKQYLD